MLLHLKRSQKDGSVLSGGKPVFVLDARVTLSSVEAQAINRHSLGGMLVYNSKEAQEHSAAAQMARPGYARKDLRGNLADDVGTYAGNIAGMAGKGALNAFMSLGHAALARMNLNIRVQDLVKGVHVEMKSLEEVIAVENAVAEACQQMILFVSTAASFNGQEQTIRFDEKTGEIVEDMPAMPAPPPQVVLAPQPLPAQPAPKPAEKFDPFFDQAPPPKQQDPLF